jgi:hypothetical protein
MTYIDPELIVDETSVAEGILAGIADRLNAALDLDPEDGWVPSEGTPETSIGEATAIVIATALSMILEQARQDYAGFGRIILGIDRLPAEPATGFSTWTFHQTGTYTIPDGSEVVFNTPDGTPVGYAVVGDVDVIAASTAADVEIVALEPGIIGNAVDDNAVAVDYEPLPFVAGVTMTTPPTGGTDDLTLDEYLDRVARRAKRMKIVPVITDDYADTAIEHPNVGRAMAVRLLNAEVYPATPASGGHVTVFVAGYAGEVLSSGIKTEVLDSMMGEDRPLKVDVHVGDPTYTNMTVAVTITLDADADSPATVLAVQAAIDEYLDPALYGYDETAPGRWRPPTSTTERTVNEYDIAGVVQDVAGVKKVTAATINGSASVALNGWAPLPNLTAPATVTVA